MERPAVLESGLQVAASWASLLCVYIEFFNIFFLGGEATVSPGPLLFRPARVNIHIP